MHISLLTKLPISISNIIPPDQNKGGLYLGNISSYIHCTKDYNIDVSKIKYLKRL